MMHAPIFSSITFVAELLVSVVVYYSLYQGYKHNRFPTKLAFAALLYEILFNISYMVSRIGASEKASPFEPVLIVVLAILHGTLSLVMFVALIVFFIVAWRQYRKGNNFFAMHKKLTGIFAVFWTISILSGIFFYILLYVL